MVFLILLVLVQTTAGAAETPTAAVQFQELLHTEWDRTLRENPTWASSLGDRRFNRLWPDQTFQAIERSHQRDVELLQALNAISQDGLDPEDQISYRLFRREYEIRVAAFPFQTYLMPINQRGGIQDEGSTADALRFETIQDYEDWIARMRAFPEFMQQTIALMRRGAERRIIHPRVIMQRIPAQIARQIVDDPTQQLFYKPFLKFPKSISENDQQRLRAEARAAVSECILPAYRQFQTFFNEEYLPACFDQVGVWQLPRGDELYALRCREYTTTELTPDEIHEIGLKEVERIRQEMEGVIREVKFTGTFQEFLEHLRSSPEFYYANGDELLRAYLAVCKRIDPQLVKLFKRLPRVPYGVEAIPSHMAPDTTTAYYREPAADGSRAGTFFVNLYRPEVRPKYEIEALALHESVPGHHLQISLAQELDGLPEFRRYGGYTVFVEGWGLYSESLGSDLGLYQDPYSRFGQLTYEMWRAVRLVVDTGMHHKHWTRQQAIDFFAANTAKTMHDIENEIDRYIAWPGQALAYKIGELKFQELKQKAKTALKEKFDIREFHDVVLHHGAVTLDILEDQVNEWIHSTSNGAK